VDSKASKRFPSPIGCAAGEIFFVAKKSGGKREGALAMPLSFIQKRGKK
jgi:hypothetical protein